MSGQKLEGPNLSEEEKSKIREQLRTAETQAMGGEAESNLEKALQDKQAKDFREALGLDLDFDPKAFITQGVIIRKGIKVAENVYVDMRSLTTKERMMAEALVRDAYGVMRLDAVYLTAIEAAMMAMSITRINRQTYESPDVSKPLNDPKEPANKLLYDNKVTLFNMFMDSSNELVTMLSVIYKNLEAVAVPTEEELKKS